jgi:hypothetical protein
VGLAVAANTAITARTKTPPISSSMRRTFTASAISNSSGGRKMYSSALESKATCSTNQRST